MSHNQSDRRYWISVLDRVARPVLAAGARGRLRASIPVEAAPGMTDRAEYTHLEAVGRLLCGIALWLENQDGPTQEAELRAEFADLARRMIASGVATGSLYLCSAALLPLGLPADDPFWADPAQPWTAKRIWAGEDAPCDHALYGRGA